MSEENMPCGSCDIGVYCEAAILNKVAREFGCLSENQRLSQMPKCKTHDRPCVGATHYHEMIVSIDGIGK